jgi:hypothetical protein
VSLDHDAVAILEALGEGGAYGERHSMLVEMQCMFVEGA